MNFKKNFKRFFTLSRNAEGFTLVELIVVIAILGILTTVAVPAYTKYVDAAGKAVDEQNLSVINSSFAVACAVNGVDAASGVSSAQLTGSDKTVTGVTVTLLTRSGATDTVTAIQNDFTDSLNGGLTFKTITVAEVQFANGTFYAESLGDGSTGGEGGNAGGGTSTVTKNDDGTYTYTYTTTDGKSYSANVTEDQLAAMQSNNTFSGIGAGALLGKVDTVANIAEGLLENETSVVSKLIYGEDGGTEYIATLAGNLGITDEAELGALLYDADGNIKNNVLANSLILTAAKETAGIDTSFLTNNVDIEQMKKDLDDPDKATTAMAQLALTYGMYTSYCQATGTENKAEGVLSNGSFSGMADALSDVNSTAFKEYMAGQGKTDLETYKASMGIISANSTDKNVAADILNNGVNSDAMAGLLGNLMTPKAAE